MATRKPRLVMIGNGMAGVRTIEELLKIAPGHYDITIFGAEAQPNYNRIMLSPVLAGERTLDDIVLNPYDWYRAQGITLHAGREVVAVDRVRRVVRADDGTEAGYDRLLLCTGSKPFMLPVPGCELAGVLAYRDMADTRRMIEAAARHRHAVVVGGGVLGLEAANGLRQRGMEVRVVHLHDGLMERQLDACAAGMLRQALEARGLQFFLGAQTESLLGDAQGRVRALRLRDGRELPADLVVMAVGIRPNTALAERMGLLVQRGIVVHDTLQTVTDARIWSVGECAVHRGTAYGLVAPLYEQARVAASHLAELGVSRYQGSLTPTRLKVTGIELFSAGHFMGGAGREAIVLRHPQAGVYKKLVIENGRLVGVCLYGDTADAAWYLELLRAGTRLDGLRGQLAFGPGAARATEAARTEELCA